MTFDAFSILTLLGGVALFLYGMHVMGTGLEKVSGGRLEKVLEKLTDNKIKAVLLGAGITAVVQSSSTTTVMLVGFVNSGIMKLSQVIGVIIGSNIGTTITSWLLSLAGISEGNIFIKMLKPSSFSPIIGVIGIILIMFIKDEKKNDIGSILIGFSLLMFGMTTMTNAVSPLGDIPEFQQMFTKFSFPLLGILVGAILTGVIQSSAASVGILQALSLTGAFTYSSALPIIMGQNIGTCVTAILSSIGTSKNAKRVAIIHLYFNIIGTVVLCIAFYSLNAIFNFTFSDQTASPFGIAIIHTIFNVFTTVILIPFMGTLEKLARLTIKDDADEEVADTTFAILDSRLLATPSFAIERCRSLVDSMSNIVRDNILLSLSLLQKYSKEDMKKILENEDLVDIYEDKIGSYLIQLSSKDLSMKDSQGISLLLHTIGDLERISDHSVNMCEIAKEIHKKNVKFSPKAIEELNIFYAAITDILNRTFASFIKDDILLAKSVEPLEDVIDSICAGMKKRHIKRLKKGKCTIESGFVLTDIISNGERVSDHCSNIAICLIQIKENSFDAHEYVLNLKKTNDSLFEDKLALFEKKYLLPQQNI